MAKKTKDPFEILGISRNITLEELERAYHNLEFLNHPDNFSTTEEKEAAEERLVEIDAAYLEAREIVSNKKSGFFESLLSGEKGASKEQVEIKDVAGKAKILKAALCKSVGKRFFFLGEKVPRGITDKFQENNENAYLYLKFKNEDRSFFDLRIEWINPYLDIYQYISNRLQLFYQ
jgi:curved DNA-binding protein CbpA